jgi:hypothetical protein
MADNGMRWCAGALAVLAAAGVACRSNTPDSPAERRERGISVVNAVGQHVAAARSFSFSSHEEGERVKRSGEKDPVTIDQTIQVRRPNGLHLAGTGHRDLEVFYDGQRFTLMSHREKVYGIVPATGSVSDVINDAIARYDIPFPLGDLIAFSAAERLVNEDTAGGWVGEETLDGQPVTKVAWQHPDLDWTIWVARDGPPLLHRLELLYKSRRGSPRRTYTLSNWEFGGELPDSLFTAVVPQDYEGIPVIQRESAALGDSTAGPTPGTAK